MNLFLIFVAVSVGVIFGWKTSKQGYTYGYDNTDIKTVLRMNNETRAVEFVLHDSPKYEYPRWREMDSSHWYKFALYNNKEVCEYGNFSKDF